MLSRLSPGLSGAIVHVLLSAPAGAASDYQQWLENAYAADGPGAAAILVKDGEVVYRGATGKADLELDVALDADHVFRIGSITKQFTAAAIVLLEEQGKLSVADDVRTHLPDFPTHGYTITIEHLLTHTSGIYNYTDIPGYLVDGRARTDLSTDELITVFRDLPMTAAPGTEFRYSNSGYVLLGAIIEQVSGQSYADFIASSFFEPLGMADSFYGGPRIVPRRARGYQRVDGAIVNADYVSMTQPHAAGALLSTVDDLARWNAALFGGEVLSEASLKKMTAHFELSNGEHSDYGYGLYIRERFGETGIFHSGGINGFATNAIWLPRQKVYAAVLSNDPLNDVSPDYLATRMAYEAAGVDYPDMHAIDVAPASLSAYPGVYRINDNETRTVTVADGRIYTQRTGGQRLEIRPHDEDAFFYPGSFTHLKFDHDSSGRVIAMDMYHDGATQAERAALIDEAAGESRVAAAISPEVYDLWAGSFELGPGVSLTVRRDGERLLSRVTGQDEVELFPSSTTRFFLRVVEAEVEFVPGDDGRAREAVVYQGGRETRAARMD